ncbi:uncharacterized protein LOC108678895 [Hyalella azteca]|uniref:Uncharacterized protein LOC108678895 n=1 Tax=Hyalella azteca TaxID=294128 RepID=A0A8B7P9Q0_HYAAZ|nr:uncharacterized protein LOC108678895 [Hyalella azteca]
MLRKLRVLLMLGGALAIIVRKPGSPAVTIRHTGLTIATGRAYAEFLGITQCQCEVKCVVNPSVCKGFSYDADATCRHIDHYELGTPRNGSTYVYYLPLGLPAGTIKREDGLYYLYNNSQAFTLDQARQTCLDKPGFRLAQAKTKQTADIFRNIHWYGDFYIGLTRLSNGSLVWMDGSPLQVGVLAANEPTDYATGVTAVMVYYGGIFSGVYYRHEMPSKSHGYLCQANYDDMPW